MCSVAHQRRDDNGKKKASKGGTLPSGSLSIIFGVVLLALFLLYMFGNMASSAPSNNNLNASSQLSGAGNINETSNPIGLTSLHSNNEVLNWLIIGVLVVAGGIISAVLIPSWL